MEVGFNSPSRKRAHFTSTKGNKARKAQGRGERNHINIIDEVDYHVGAFPYPFRGHEVACRLLQPLWGRQRPTVRSYSHSLSLSLSLSLSCYSSLLFGLKHPFFVLCCCALFFPVGTLAQSVPCVCRGSPSAATSSSFRFRAVVVSRLYLLSCLARCLSLFRGRSFVFCLFLFLLSFVVLPLLFSFEVLSSGVRTCTYLYAVPVPRNGRQRGGAAAAGAMRRA